MTMHIWLAFAGASLILLMIPGPTILLVIGDSLTNRGRSSWSTVAGVAAGDLTAMSLSLGGAGALLAASANAFTALKIVGGCYLVYLGLKSIWGARHAHRAPLAAVEKSPSQRFVAAWAVTSLNPKSIVFFVAFVPQFISPEGSFLMQAVVFLVTFVMLAALNAAVFGLLARRLASGLSGAAAQRQIGYAGGAVLVGAGALTLALRSR
ncbi:LysE family translocator [Pandoraea sp.]|uniref:LysE family translocator n=1 Tax=Pandoraea sp. TaxID=1883445 RepID=UPI00121BA9EB|nr:LysE family translocator [Pandoraea sp.]TAL56460.1 MAG: LysE family translocator [Pandoraea sp.]TAM15279.1 MAG: LysE family translocator [Pandoraea sp.]